MKATGANKRPRALRAPGPQPFETESDDVTIAMGGGSVASAAGRTPDDAEVWMPKHAELHQELGMAWTYSRLARTVEHTLILLLSLV